MPQRSVPGAGWFRIGSGFFSLVCFTRAIAYSAVFGPAHESPGPMLMTDGGRNLPWFAAAWAVIGVVLAWEGVTGKIRRGLPLMAAMMTMWGASYVAAWFISDLDSPDWITACLYIFIAAGLGSVGVAMTRTLAWAVSVVRQAVTGAVPVQRRGDGSAADPRH